MDEASPRPKARLDLFKFVPFRLNRLAAEVSSALAVEYQERHGLDIPAWRVIATLGFRNDACSAQYIAQCTRTHKSTISRAVTTLLHQGLIERVENEADRREFRLQLTKKGARCTKSCSRNCCDGRTRSSPASPRRSGSSSRRCSARSRQSLDLVQTREEADAKEAY